MGEVRVEETIDASPAAVWAVLSDIGSWDDWNDVMVDTRCDRPELGAVISFRLAIGPGLPIKTKLVEWHPERSLAWGDDLGRILRIQHGFELETVSGGTRVVHYEYFRGAIGRAVWPFLRRSLFRAYPRFLVALKERVEQKT